ncbi:MAG: hypothetical protein ABR992_10945 [Solirubrobacteraceae bacterium]
MPANRQQSALVHSAPPIVVLALAGNVFGFLVFAAITFAIILAFVFLSSHSEGSVYDQIGSGGISRDGENPSSSAAMAPDSQAAAAERETEARQMLSARSERLVRNGQPALDIDAELARLLAAQTPARHDAGIVAEVRQLVMARNERRLRQGLEPLDVDSEVTRTLTELEP